jgi:hypothetical protein
MPALGAPAVHQRQSSGGSSGAGNAKKGQQAHLDDLAKARAAYFEERRALELRQRSGGNNEPASVGASVVGSVRDSRDNSSPPASGPSKEEIARAHEEALAKARAEAFAERKKLQERNRQSIDGPIVAQPVDASQGAAAAVVVHSPPGVGVAATVSSPPSAPPSNNRSNSKEEAQRQHEEELAKARLVSYQERKALEAKRAASSSSGSSSSDNVRSSVDTGLSALSLRQSISDDASTSVPAGRV